MIPPSLQGGRWGGGVGRGEYEWEKQGGEGAGEREGRTGDLLATICYCCCRFSAHACDGMCM